MGDTEHSILLTLLTGGVCLAGQMGCETRESRSPSAQPASFPAGYKLRLAAWAHLQDIALGRRGGWLPEKPPPSGKEFAEAWNRPAAGMVLWEEIVIRGWPPAWGRSSQFVWAHEPMEPWAGRHGAYRLLRVQPSVVCPAPLAREKAWALDLVGASATVGLEPYLVDQLDERSSGGYAAGSREWYQKLLKTEDKGELRSALAHGRKFGQRSRKTAVVLLGLGLIHEKLGEYGTAIGHYRAVPAHTFFGIHPPTEHWREPRSEGLARCYAALGQDRRATWC